MDSDASRPRNLLEAFGKKKLNGDPDKMVIQVDLLDIQKFGVLGSIVADENAQQRIIHTFVEHCFGEVSRGPEATAKADKLLEALAAFWPGAWLELAEFRIRVNADKQSISYALRRAVEEQPSSKEAWLKRADFEGKDGDEATQIASLVSAVETAPSDVELLREVAFQLCRYLNAHITEIPKARRGVYLASVRSHMERLAHKLDATGLSRLAWLFLLEGNVDKAKEYANRGCSIDTLNPHCLKILERIEGQSS